MTRVTVHFATIIICVLECWGSSGIGWDGSGCFVVGEVFFL